MLLSQAAASSAGSKPQVFASKDTTSKQAVSLWLTYAPVSLPFVLQQNICLTPCCTAGAWRTQVINLEPDWSSTSVHSRSEHTCVAFVEHVAQNSKQVPHAPALLSTAINPAADPRLHSSTAQGMSHKLHCSRPCWVLFLSAHTCLFRFSICYRLPTAPGPSTSSRRVGTSSRRPKDHLSP